jgi:hypothetical protein
MHELFIIFLNLLSNNTTNLTTKLVHKMSDQQFQNFS